MQLDVTILGRDYRVACAENEREALLQAVAHLDSRMREIRDGGKVAGVDKIAVMAALNIANDLLRERRHGNSGAAGANGSGAQTGVDAPDAQRRIKRMQLAIENALAAQDKLL